MERTDRIKEALDKYEKGELKTMATYKEIRESEKELLEAAGDNKAFKMLVRVMAKSARLSVRQLKFNKMLNEIKEEMTNKIKEGMI